MADSRFGVVLLIGSLLFGIWLLHQLYFVVLPRRMITKYGETDPERLRQYLERVVATPSLLGRQLKLVARMALVGIYLPRGQHAEAAAHCRANLESFFRIPNREHYGSLEADIRRRLADCLEALGQADEAANERRRAAEANERAPGAPLKHLYQGTQLERQHRYEAAYTEYQLALDFTPPHDTRGRIECMFHLVLTAFNTGRPVECLNWANQVIALGATGTFLRGAHRLAGVACGNLGQLEESETHFRLACEVSAAANQTADLAETLGCLADCLRKRGKLAEANEACIRVRALHAKGERMSLAVQAEILRESGRYDEALALFAQYKLTTPLVIPHFEKRVMAACALDIARTEAECGRGSDAWSHIQEAIDILGNDAKLGLKCQAAAAWILAVRGLADESHDLASQIEKQLKVFERDPSTCRGILHDLGMAACTRGDHHSGITCWTRYLELTPDPVHQPTAYYFRGECHRGLGHREEARADYQASVAMNLDTYHTRLARRQLGEFTAP